MVVTDCKNIVYAKSLCLNHSNKLTTYYIHRWRARLLIRLSNPLQVCQYAGVSPSVCINGCVVGCAASLSTRTVGTKSIRLWPVVCQCILAQSVCLCPVHEARWNVKSLSVCKTGQLTLLKVLVNLPLDGHRIAALLLIASALQVGISWDRKCASSCHSNISCDFVLVGSWCKAPPWHYRSALHCRGSENVSTLTIQLSRMFLWMMSSPVFTFLLNF